jgi:hypothetical protein
MPLSGFYNLVPPSLSQSFYSLVHVRREGEGGAQKSLVFIRFCVMVRTLHLLLFFHKVTRSNTIINEHFGQVLGGQKCTQFVNRPPPPTPHPHPFVEKQYCCLRYRTIERYVFKYVNKHNTHLHVCF